MDKDKAQEFIDDVTGEGGSNCCGAAVYELGESFICKDCKEYCEIEKDEPSDESLTVMDSFRKVQESVKKLEELINEPVSVKNLYGTE